MASKEVWVLIWENLVGTWLTGLGAQELAERLCVAFDCLHYEHLSVDENAA